MMNKPIDCLITGILLFFLVPAYNQDSEISVISFKNSGNLIVVEASVKGQKGNFVFDTGAPGLLLNATHFKDVESDMDYSPVHGVTGEIKKAKYVEIGLGHFKKKVRAWAIDLTNIERAKKIKLLGLIGYDVFRNYEIVFDFARREITLMKTDRKGNTNYYWDAFQRPTDTIAIKMFKHIPYVPVQIGNGRLKLAIDSGAASNYINEINRTKVADFFHPQKKTKVVGMDGIEVPSMISGKLEQIQVEDINYGPMKTIIMDLGTIEKSAWLDGFLGVEFLKQYKTAINYRKKEIYIWDHGKTISDVVVSTQDTSFLQFETEENQSQNKKNYE